MGRKAHLAAVALFLLALAMLLIYRPVLKTIGVDLDRTVPEWADFMGPWEYEAFLRQVQAYFDARGVQIRIHNDKAYPEDGGEYNLRLLAQRCHRVKRGEWAGMIREYFARHAEKAEE